MLVLSRKKDEQIVIRIGGEMVVVRIVDMGRDRVRLGVIAPTTVTVHREEVARRLDDWQKELDELLEGAILHK